MANKTASVVKSIEDQTEAMENEMKNEPDKLHEIYEMRYREVLKQKEDLEKDKIKLANKLIKLKDKVVDLHDEVNKMRIYQMTESDDISSTLRKMMKIITNAVKDSKKLYNSRPKAPIIDLNKIFEDHIKVLQFKVDHSALGLK